MPDSLHAASPKKSFRLLMLCCSLSFLAGHWNFSPRLLAMVPSDTRETNKTHLRMEQPVIEAHHSNQTEERKVLEEDKFHQPNLKLQKSLEEAWSKMEKMNNNSRAQMMALNKTLSSKDTEIGKLQAQYKSISESKEKEAAKFRAEMQTLQAASVDALLSASNQTARQRCAFCDISASLSSETLPHLINDTALWDHIWTPLTTLSMIRRTRKNIGNVGRLQNFLRKLCRGEPTNILLLGGSNTRGAQIPSSDPRFPERIEKWLNQAFPVHEQYKNQKHLVYNRGSGGCGACVYSSDLHSYLTAASPQQMDLLLTEFAVNDGIGHQPHTSPQHEKSRLCFEALVRTAFEYSPQLALVPIELANKEVEFNGVASHHDISSFYSLPVLSWRDAVYPDMRSGIGPKFAGMRESVAARRGKDPWKELITKQDLGHKSSALWVDNRHINLWGHQVVLDAFVYLVQQEISHAEIVEPEKLPTEWLVPEIIEWEAQGAKQNRKQIGQNTISGPIDSVGAEGPSFYRSTAAGERRCDGDHWSYTILRKEGYKKDMQFKTKEQKMRMCLFEPITKSDNFTLYEDRPRKPGWISTSSIPQSITFEVPLPRLPHPEVPYKQFSVRVGYLRSYEHMCRFDVAIQGAEMNLTETTLDGHWDRHRSTSEEAEVAVVTEGVNVTITTKPDSTKGRTKAKILWIRAVGR